MYEDNFDSMNAISVCNECLMYVNTERDVVLFINVSKVRSYVVRYGAMCLKLESDSRV